MSEIDIEIWWSDWQWELIDDDPQLWRCRYRKRLADPSTVEGAT